MSFVSKGFLFFGRKREKRERRGGGGKDLGWRGRERVAADWKVDPWAGSERNKNSHWNQGKLTVFFPMWRRTIFNGMSAASDYRIILYARSAWIICMPRRCFLLILTTCYLLLRLYCCVWCWWWRWLHFLPPSYLFYTFSLHSCWVSIPHKQCTQSRIHTH